VSASSGERIDLEMALVLLPCDLPTWPTLQRHLNAMKREVRTAVQLKDALLKIYNLCK
jgi:hypothetical protein